MAIKAKKKKSKQRRVLLSKITSRFAKKKKLKTKKKTKRAIQLKKKKRSKKQAIRKKLIKKKKAQKKKAQKKTSVKKTEIIEKEDSFSSTDPTQIYLHELGYKPLFTAKEELRVAKQVKRGSKKARIQMIEANLRLVVKIARQYVNRGLAFLY